MKSKPLKSPPTFPDEERCWAAVLARDSAYDGAFYYGVKTTGVYCRPSCPSRRASRSNVRFYQETALARAAGLRPCQRCHPDDPNPRLTRDAERIAAACRTLENAATWPGMAALAAAAHCSVSHFQRLFKQVTSLTPRAYAAGVRAARARNALAQEDQTITEAFYSAGYNSSGRFYEQSSLVLGMTPSRYRSRGKGMRIHFAIGECSLGAVLVAQSEQGVCALTLGDDPQALIEAFQDRFALAELIGADPAFEQTVAQVVAWLERPAAALPLPLDLRGTTFQQRVWRALSGIPPGTTVSYREIAERIGMPQAVRAVAGACAANPVAVMIPCHRVVRKNGELSGYRWGIARKQALLDREKINAAQHKAQETADVAPQAWANHASRYKDDQGACVESLDDKLPPDKNH